MTIGQALLAIITGLAINECCDVAPWLARKLVRWSARRRYVPPARAEELAAYIDDCLGKLINPLWQPTTLTVPVHHEETDRSAHPHVYVVHQAWCQLTDEVRDAARELGVGSRSWQRCIKKLRRITEDERWMLIARNLDLLKKSITHAFSLTLSAAGPFQVEQLIGAGRLGYGNQYMNTLLKPVIVNCA